MWTVIPYGDGELEARLDGETWWVRLGELEESSPYLDYALSRLLDVDAKDVHRLAARVIERSLSQAQRLPTAVGAGTVQTAGSAPDQHL